MTLAEPHAIICLTSRGQRADVAFRYDGKHYVDLYDPMLKQRRRETFRRYRVFIEVPWETSEIRQIAILGWHDDITFIFDVPGLTEEEAVKWAQAIDIRDVAPKISPLPRDGQNGPNGQNRPK
jgi:hypothetical protein